MASLAAAGHAPMTVLLRCHKFLKPSVPSPPQRLIIDDVLADEGATHLEWCN